jgi:hypothetical protein
MEKDDIMTGADVFMLLKCTSRRFTSWRTKASSLKTGSAGYGDSAEAMSLQLLRSKWGQPVAAL